MFIRVLTKSLLDYRLYKTRESLSGGLKWNNFWDWWQQIQSEISEQIETNLQKSGHPQEPEWPHRTPRVWRGLSSPCSQATHSGAWGLCEWCHWYGSISTHPRFVSGNGCKKHYLLSDMQGWTWHTKHVYYVNISNQWTVRFDKKKCSFTMKLRSYK